MVLGVRLPGLWRDADACQFFGCECCEEECDDECGADEDGEYGRVCLFLFLFAVDGVRAGFEVGGVVEVVFVLS